MKFIALLPLLSNDHGHVLVYNLAVQEACTRLGWEFSAYVPKNCTVKELPPQWHKSLASYDHTDERGIFIKKTLSQQISAYLKNLAPLFSILRKSRGATLFIESFSPAEIAALATVIALLRPECDLLILLRKEPRQIPYIGHLYRKLIHRIEKQIKGRLTLLTDSSLLIAQNAAFFERPVHLMPIPHTKDPVLKDPLPRENFVWWPGGDPARYKGLQTIQWLVQRSSGTLHVSINAKEHLPFAHMNLVFLEPFLDRNAYWTLMQRARFVLFPNEPKAYQAATSGIFVETIVAGGVPLVRDGTWMAHELKRFGLTQLISHFGPGYDEIAVDEERLAAMRNHYREYHCIENFAQKLLSVIHS